MSEHDRIAGARLVAVKEVHDDPGILKADLTQRLRDVTGMSSSTVRQVVRELEAEGHLLRANSAWPETYRPARVG